MIDIKTIITELEDTFKIKFEEIKSTKICNAYASYRSKKKAEYSWFIYKYSTEILVSYYVDILKDNISLSCAEIVTDESHLYNFLDKVEDVDDLAKKYL